MRSLFALFIALSIALLAGCIPLAATGIGATALLLEDRRSAGIYIEDENIEWKSRAAILNKFSEAHINITSFNLGVLLTGEAPSEQVKMEIAETVRAIPSVRNVTNEIVVAGNSSLASRSSDTIITTNTKTRFLNNGKFSPNHVKVVTEAGVLFMMGIVTREEADAAAEIARTTSGVSRVVKVFEYVAQPPAKP